MSKNLLTRDFLFKMSSDFAKIFDEIELQALNKIRTLIESGETNPKKIMKALNALFNKNDVVIKTNLKKIFENTQTGTIEVILKELAKGKVLKSSNLNAVLTEILTQQNKVLKKIINKTFKNYLRFKSTMLKTANKNLITIFQQSQSLLTSGVPLEKILKETLSKKAVQLFEFKDKAGRNWNARSYLEMNLRTTTAQLNQETQNETLKEFGYDLVIVNVLADSCKLCEPFENQVLSISGKDKDYTSFSVAEGAGYKHPNCRHSENLFIEGVSTKAHKQNAQVTQRKAEQRERQRYIERQIRDYKKRAIFDERYNAKVREWQKEMREFINETGRTRQYNREQ